MAWHNIGTREVCGTGCSKPIFLKNESGANRHRFFVDVTNGEGILETSYDSLERHLNSPEKVHWNVYEIGRFDSDLGAEVIGVTAVRLRAYETGNTASKMVMHVQTHV